MEGCIPWTAISMVLKNHFFYNEQTNKKIILSLEVESEITSEGYTQITVT